MFLEDKYIYISGIVYSPQEKYYAVFLIYIHITKQTICLFHYWVS